MNNPTFGLPSPTLPMGDTETGLVASAWYQWVTRISQLSAERPIAAITVVGISPFVYRASTIGHVFVTGGALDSIVLKRGGVSLTCPSDIFIPVAANDTITVSYASAPDMTFVPSARA